jgi:type IV pilus assembly protein PilC
VNKVKINSYEITDFLKQLALLTRSELPLPDALTQLSHESRGKKLKKLIQELSDSADKGKTLSQAMSEHPETFPSFYIKMIALAEKEGTLSSVLSELAQISRFQYMLVNMIRDVMLYPLITIGVAFLIMFFLCYTVIPVFGKIFDDLLQGEPLPMLTQWILNISYFIKNYIYEFIVIYIFSAVFMVWLFCNNGLGNKILLRLSRYIPFSEVIFYNFAMARLCTLWAIMMRRKISVEESFPVIAEVMEFPQLSNALNEIARKCKKGEDIKQCLKEENNISRLLIMMLDNSKEANLPEELDKLASLFRDRASYGYRRVGMAWETISMGAMVLVVAGLILFLFFPFINMLRIF